MAAARRKRGAGTLALALILIVTIAAIIWVPRLWEQFGDVQSASSRCTVTLGDRSDSKTAEQANNAALIVAGSSRWGLPARAGTIAIATAIQESSLRNIDYGDRDSIGLFQQRPSQGWGTIEQIMDPYYSTDKFYEALIKVSEWSTKEITVAAQDVQRSGFPLAYADHEEEGRLWASSLTGNGGTVSCDLPSPSEPTTPRAFVQRVEADFGTRAYTVEIVGADGTDTTLRLTAADGQETSDAALQAWAVSVASSEAVTASVGRADAWVRDGSEPTASPDSGTLVSLRTAVP
ncbi:hypothetical protein ON058_04315 [Demequina sp. B12]|uniref:hypothetical protein n=1 Tax=Demequina sp. B12 TaxID=2992757 RepID=UPI00237BD985|nr:hypothetical protein [Demequina sp. B12]MDE0572636.1 hypothetical protein [Demequina sp. B12]